MYLTFLSQYNKLYICVFVTGKTFNAGVLSIWYQTQLQHYTHLFTITDLLDSFCDGLALCALVELYRPHICQLITLVDASTKERVEMGLAWIEQEFDVEPMFSVDEEYKDWSVDKLAMLTYLTQLHEVLKDETPIRSKS